MHIRASHETASLATAALTDVLIVSAFFSRQTCNKIYSVESVSLKHSVSNNMDGKYFQGNVEDMRRAGLHRTMFMFLIQWFLHYFTWHENHSYPNGACLASFSSVRSINFASKSISRHQKCSFAGVDHYDEDSKEAHQAQSFLQHTFVWLQPVHFQSPHMGLSIR